MSDKKTFCCRLKNETIYKMMILRQKHETERAKKIREGEMIEKAIDDLYAKEIISSN